MVPLRPRWQEAFEAGVAPPVVLASTHAATLEWVQLGDLVAHVISLGARVQRDGGRTMSGTVVSVDRVIEAPPAAIFAVVADASRHPEIDGSGALVRPKRARRSGSPWARPSACP